MPVFECDKCEDESAEACAKCVARSNANANVSYAADTKAPASKAPVLTPELANKIVAAVIAGVASEHPICYDADTVADVVLDILEAAFRQ